MSTETTTALVERYIAMWNETEPQSRRALIERTWAEGASYLDPLMRGDGADGIDAMVQGVQDRFPGHRFRRTGEVDAHHDRARFTWELAPDGGGDPLVAGLDVAVISPDGRLLSVTGFLDRMPRGAPG